MQRDTKEQGQDLKPHIHVPVALLGPLKVANGGADKHDEVHRQRQIVDALPVLERLVQRAPALRKVRRPELRLGLAPQHAAEAEPVRAPPQHGLRDRPALVLHHQRKGEAVDDKDEQREVGRAERVDVDEKHRVLLVRKQTGLRVVEHAAVGVDRLLARAVGAVNVRILDGDEKDNLARRGKRTARNIV